MRHEPGDVEIWIMADAKAMLIAIAVIVLTVILLSL